MSLIKCLFIGGSVDGQFRSVTKGVKRVEIPIAAIIGYAAESYSLHEILDSDGSSHFVYVGDGVVNPVGCLLNSYAENRK